MTDKQILIVVMGVSGCGKSAVASAMAPQLAYQLLDADEFHTQENSEHMASGLVLSEAMHQPWIALLQAHLKQSAKAGRNCVLSFSALRRVHRAKIRDLPFKSIFIHLSGPQALIAERFKASVKHPLPASLLDSQYASLEPASKKETITTINIDQSFEGVVADAMAAVKLQITPHS